MCPYRKGKHANLDVRRSPLTLCKIFKEQLKEVIYGITYRRRQERSNTVENGIFETGMGLEGAMNSGFVPYMAGEKFGITY